MKAFILASLCTLILGSQAFARDLNYQYISESLQAINSDVYMGLSKAEIDNMLNDVNAYGHDDAVMVAKRAAAQTGELTDKEAQCIADSLQAYNSDIYMQLTKAEVTYLLDNVDVYGHDDAVAAAKRCNVK